MTVALAKKAVGHDPVADRQPPYSEDAEQAVLAAMMMDTDAIMRASELLDDTMFYREGHRRIYRAMIAIVERGAVVDPLTLADELERRDELKASGGKDYVAFLVDAIPTAANIEYHALIVKEKALVRRLIEASTATVQLAFDGGHTAGELLDDAEHRILQISRERRAGGLAPLKDMIYPAIERIEELGRAGKTITGIPSGFANLDDKTSGFQASDLVVIAGRPSMGKSALALNIAQYANTQGVYVAIFSLEMDQASLVQRFLASEALVDVQRIRQGMTTPEDNRRLGRAAGAFMKSRIRIDDSAVLTVLDIRSRVRRMKAECDVGLIVVDYLQLIRPSRGGPSQRNREQEISDISRSLKALAKELAVPVIALSQLSRDLEKRADRRPQLSDLRESGAIEQDADLVLFIYRPEVYGEITDKDGGSLEGTAELILAKQRNGPTGMARLYWRKEYTRFENMTQRPDPNAAGRPERRLVSVADLDYRKRDDDS